MFLLSFIIVSAINVDELTNEMELAKSEIIGQELPGPLATMFGNEKVNIHVNLESGDKLVVAVVTENNKLTSFDFNTLSDPTLNVYLDDVTLAKIQSAKDPLKELKNALDQEKITYKAVGFWKKIKFAFLSMFVNMLGGFSDNADVDGVVVEEIVVEDSEDNLEETKDDLDDIDDESLEIDLDDDEELEDLELDLDDEDFLDEIFETEEESVEEDTEPVTDEEIDLEETNDLEEDSEDEELVSDEQKEDHIIKMTDEGFSKDELSIKVGEKITWENVRNGKFKQAMIIGTQKCGSVKSKFFNPDESFSWTFEEPVNCLIVDGIMTTKSMKLIVS